MNIDELKAVVIDALEDMKAQDIQVVDVRDRSDITDLMIIASGTSNRQVKSIAQNVAEKSKEAGCAALGMEGEASGEWVLVDLGDVVVHVMQPHIREFYQLERLWSMQDAEPISKTASN